MGVEGDHEEGRIDHEQHDQKHYHEVETRRDHLCAVVTFFGGGE
jgi:hypothetical protein